jgi:hypothetical protein
MGGKRTRDDSPANVVVLHDFCHKWLHEHPTIARIHGLIVPSWGDPADVLPSTVPGLDGLRRGHNPR